MRKTILLYAAVLLGSSLFAQSNKDEKEIIEMLNKQTVSWNNGNLDDFMNTYWKNDSLMYIGKNGVTYGYNNVLNNYKKNYVGSEQMGKLFFEIIKVKKLSPEYYWVLGKYFLKRSVGNAGGQYTLLIRKIKGKWLIIADHSSAS